MELDDFKQSWNKPDLQKNKNKNIMELIQQKSYGPVAALKSSLRKQIAMMLILPGVLLLTNTNDISKPLNSILFWAYVAFCVGVIIFSYLNYRTVQKMEGMDGKVKNNLVKQINQLETQMRWKMSGVRIMSVLMMVLLEILPYYQDYRMLNTWHSLHPAIRFGSYAGFLVLQYFLSRRVSEIKFGRHIRYLKDLVKEME